MRRIFNILAVAALLMVLCVGRSSAQHTIAVTGGAGFSSARLYPAQEMIPVWGTYSTGVSWRYYSMPRFVGCIGVDVELMQRGFSFIPYPSRYEKNPNYPNKKSMPHYTRKYHSIMVPIVWQPHVYLFKNHMRIYLEAAPTFCYNFASTFENTEPLTINQTTTAEPVSGKYTFRSERDNRFSFGLAGGVGFDLIFGQFEIGVKARYDFGFSDILRNRNKYYDYAYDMATNPGENPFYYTPLRSPVDNLNISMRVGFRIGKAGFKEWEWKRPKFPKNKEVFKYAL